MKPERILVTGGAGYLGCRLIYDLINKFKCQIIVYDNFSRGKLEAVGSLLDKYKYKIEIIPWEYADIRDEENFKNALKKYKPEVVINLASIVDAFQTNREGKDRECEIVNYESSVNIANLSNKFGVKIFICQSSVSIYSRGEEIKEDSPTNPLSVYGLAKFKAGEEIRKLNSKNFKTCVLRSATYVGYTPGFTYQTIINLACIRALYDIPINIFESALDNNKTYLDVKDESAAIIFAIENIDKMQGQVFNITSFHANLREVIRLIEEEIDRPIKKNIIKEKTINQQVYTVNSDKIKALGFKPNGRLDKIIPETIKYLKRRMEGFKFTYDSNI